MGRTMAANVHVPCSWMLRKLVARFLPPTSFQEATNFLQQAISHGYHDLKAAAVRFETIGQMAYWP